MNLEVTVTETPDVAGEAARIACERIKEIAFNCNYPGNDGLELAFVARFKDDGFTLHVSKDKVVVSASETREFIAGVGKLLILLRQASEENCSLAERTYTDKPTYPLRLHYMPAHFGNSFEAAWPSEMQRYLEDMALAGASGYGDWFDPNDMSDPYNPDVYCVYSTSMALWQRKKDVLRLGKRLGLDTMLVITHNVGFLDQMRPEWMGVRSHAHRVQGQVLCPSNPEARRICLQNHDNLFHDLLASGVQVDKLCYGPYDDGGCACEKCQPYYPTFLKMVGEIHDIARRYFPDIKGDIIGWWTADEEIEQLREFARGPAGDWFSSFQFSATYGVFELPDLQKTLNGVPLSTFVHIGFSHDPRDVYIKSGIHSAPRRLQSVIGSFAQQKCQGFHTYNESFGDHYNAYLCSRLGRDPGADTAKLTADYCRQMYGLTGQNLKAMVGVLLEMEDKESEKAEGWLEVLKLLRSAVTVPSRQRWVFEQVAISAELMALDYRIGHGDNWHHREDVEPVLALIQKRFALSERLWRDIYGLGVLRQLFTPERIAAVWYPHYNRLFPRQDGFIRPGGFSKNA